VGADEAEGVMEDVAGAAERGVPGSSMSEPRVSAVLISEGLPSMVGGGGGGGGGGTDGSIAGTDGSITGTTVAGVGVGDGSDANADDGFVTTGDIFGIC